MSLSSAFGVKLGTAVFGFAGGVISLAFVRGLSKPMAAASVAVGLVTSIALTPLVAGWFGVVNDSAQNGVAFIIGLCAMSGLPLLHNAFRNWLARVTGADVEH